MREKKKHKMTLPRGTKALKAKITVFGHTLEFTRPDTDTHLFSATLPWTSSPLSLRIPVAGADTRYRATLFNRFTYEASAERALERLVTNELSSGQATLETSVTREIENTLDKLCRLRDNQKALAKEHTVFQAFKRPVKKKKRGA